MKRASLLFLGALLCSAPAAVLGRGIATAQSAAPNAEHQYVIGVSGMT